MATQNIGSFGVVHDDYLDLTFTYFGEEMRVNPEAGELSYLDFMARATAVEKRAQDAEGDEDEAAKADAEGVLITMGFLRDLIHPDDWDQFLGLAKRYRQKLDDLMVLAKSIVEFSSGFPTGQQSDSPDGLPATQQKSKAVSSRPASKRAGTRAIGAKGATKAEIATARAYELLEGRPDLMAAVELAQTKGAPLASAVR